MATATKKKAQPKKTAASKKNTAAKHFCSLRRQKPGRVLAAGVDGRRAKMIIEHEKRWTAGSMLRYWFFNDPSEGVDLEDENGNAVFKSYIGTKAQMNVVRKAFGIWKNTGINLKFKEVKKREDADIKIAFLPDNDSWSYIGRDVLNPEEGDPRTMNFGWNIAVRDRHNGIDTALHEIGHTLGFPHEHQNPIAGIVWNEPAVYKSLGGDPNFWDKKTTYNNIIKKIKRREVRGSTWDANSIMHYQFEPGLVKEPIEFKRDGIFPRGGLSHEDIQYALSFYPPTNEIGETRVKAMSSFPIYADNGKQQDFVFTPTETREYSIQTFGTLDTVLVLWEKKRNGDLEKIKAEDDGGTDDNAKIVCTLQKGKSYRINAKVYFKKEGEQTLLMIA